MRADRQTGGRGRRGRVWVSDAGNLFASTLVRLKPSDPPAHLLGFVAALALHRAFTGWIAASRLTLKWPNDVLLDGAKVSGILLERQDQAVIVGFGVNLVHHPENVERPAISFSAAGIDAPSPDMMIQALMECWAVELARWRAEGFAPVRESWMRLAHPIGTRLAARLTDDEECYGEYRGVAADGALLLRLADGSTRVIHAGDIFAL